MAMAAIGNRQPASGMGAMGCLLLAGLLLGTPATFAAPAAVPAGEFSPQIFDYARPAELQVREALPPASRPESSPRTEPLSRQRTLIFRNVRGEDVPVLVSLPPRGKGPFPAVVVVHGFSSSKDQVTTYLEAAFMKAGFALVALDLPMHGDRGEKPEEMFPPGDPRRSYENIIRAVQDIRQTIDLVTERKEFSATAGVKLVGYSMGAWLGTLAAAADNRVNALVLMVAGSASNAPDSRSRPRRGAAPTNEAALLEQYPGLSHDVALRRIAPRPVLMQNGKRDPYIPRERVEALYKSARDPKTLKWYDSGHLLAKEAYPDAADWLARQKPPARKR